MSINQQISRQLLFVKNRKLFYLFLASAQKNVQKISDSFVFQQKHSYSKDNCFVIEDQMSVVFQVADQLNSNNINIETIGQFFKITDHLNEDIMYYDKLENVSDFYQVYVYQDQFFQKEQVKKFLSNQDVIEYSYTDKIVFDDYSKGGSQINSYNYFEISDQNSYNEFKFSGDDNIQLQDKYNSVYMKFSDDYIYQLFVQNQFYAEVNKNVLFDNILFKQLYKDVSYKNIYLKLYKLIDGQKIIIKSFQLKPIKKFDFNLDSLVIRDTYSINNGQKNFVNYIDFSVDQLHQYSYWQKNIYHSNDICEKFCCSFLKNHNTVVDNLQYQILNFNNVDLQPFIVMYKNSMITFRINFNKYNTQTLNTEQLLLYIKKIFFSFDRQVNTENIQIYYKVGFNNYDVSKYTYKKYDESNCFFANYLDIMLVYYGNKTFVLQSLNIFAFDFHKNCAIEDDFVVGESNCLNLSKQNVENGKWGSYAVDGAIQTFDPTNKYISNIRLFNVEKTIKEQQFYTSESSQSLSEMFFDISSNTIIDGYRYIYAQYATRKKESDNLFDLQAFDLFGRKNNIPKKVYLIYNQKKYLFKYSGYTEENGGLTMFYRWNIVDLPSNMESIYFDFCKKYDNINKVWKIYFVINMLNLFSQIYYVQLDDQKLVFQYENNEIDVIKNNFVIEDTLLNLEFRIEQCEENKSYVDLYTKINSNSNSQQWQKIQFKSSLLSSDILNRNIKIEWKNGQKQKIELYAVVLSKNNLLEGFNSSFKYSLINNEDNTLKVVLNNNQINLTQPFCNSLHGLNYYYDGQKYQYFSHNKPFFNTYNQIVYQKTNLHITWENDFQHYYLIWMDVFNQHDFVTGGKYFQYLQPFYDFYETKIANKKYISNFYNKGIYFVYQQIFQFEFGQPQNIIKINHLVNKKISKDYKVDCFYSYTINGYDWFDYKFINYVAEPFVAKGVKVKRLILKREELEITLDDVCLKTVNTKNYYLTNKNYFETNYLNVLQNGTKYFINLIAIDQDKICVGDFKIFEINNMPLIENIQSVQVDNIQCATDNVIMVSGMDNQCQFSFKIVNQNFSKIFFVLYASYNNEYILLQNFQLTKNQLTKKDGLYSFKYNFKDVNFDHFAFDAKIYDIDYNVSDYCYASDPNADLNDMAKFKINKLPTTPNNLDVEGIQF